ncbi:hypothetical protein [Hufsiella ginkgonis]|uniref:Uncharacterized protein n=1 Tax=Hufsiella ginkgonis TaxID=2695274 RepID=A0A7K1XTI4_9SPHI|nr:hypothetical protein [Hufsiella ginkgonis]MXV14323.1 hypothetical protein [Hufsiella ginkgonis]
MKFILKLKHWQAFIFIMIGVILSNFTVENNSSVTTVIRIVGIVLYFLWPFLVGNGLYHYLPERIELNYNLFVINSGLWLTIYLAAMIISDGQGITFTGVYVLLMFYVIYAVLNYLAFPAQLLKSLEVGKKARLSDYIGDFFLVAFLPIGIWFLQSRVNKIVDNQASYNE